MNDNLIRCIALLLLLADFVCYILAARASEKRHGTYEVWENSHAWWQTICPGSGFYFYFIRPG